MQVVDSNGFLKVKLSGASDGITIGTTAITSGTVGRVLFQGTGNVVQQSSSLFWDATNNRLGIGTSTPDRILVLQQDGGNFIRMVRNLSTTEFSMAITNVRLGSGSAGGVFFANEYEFRNSAGTSAFLTINSGNVLINTTTDAGFRLDVNGTARVQGQLTTSVNQNNPTRISLTNTTSGTLAGTEILLNTHSGALMAVGKVSNAYTPYKTLAAGDGYLYNTTFGDISLLNDFASGRIKFAAGGASTAQMTLFSTGNVGINTTTDAGFRLDVNGTARVSATDGVSAFQITAPTRAWYFTTSPAGGTFNAISGAANGAAGTGNFGFVLSGGWGFHIGQTTSQSNSFLSVYASGTNNGELILGVQTSVASSLLTMNSTTKGFLPPRMTTTQKNAIATPATGLQVYDTTLNRPCFYDGTTWITL